MKKTREEKAITLIALIITIVVLLILAVVAINAVTGEGIIQHATNAKTEYEEVQDEENSMISYYQTYLNAKGQVGKWVQEKNTIKKVNSDGKVDTIEVGDYFDYKSGVASYKDESGNEKAWKVLGAENGKILLVSEDNVAAYEVIQDQMYIRGEEDLNNLCAGYKNDLAESARSINVDDINKITGYNPETMSIEVGFGKYRNVITYRRDTADKVTYTTTGGEEGAINQNGVYYNLSYVEDNEWKVLDIGGMKILTNRGYSYDGSEIMTQTYNQDMASSKEYKLLFKNSSNEGASYWLASKVIFTVSDNSNGWYGSIYFGLRGILSEGVKKIGVAGSTAQTANLGVRAVVTLKSDIQLVKNTVDGVTTWSVEE